MSDEKKNIFGLPATRPGTDIANMAQAMSAGLDSAIQANPTANGGSSFLALGRGDGKWTFGAERLGVDEDAIFAVNPQTLEHGWLAWGAGKLAGRSMGSVFQPLQPASALPPVGEEWQYAQGMQMVALDGDDRGTPLTYETTSYGGNAAMKKLLTEFRVQLGVDPKRIIPVIRLASEPYTHKAYGRVFNPVFEIVQWWDGVEELVDDVPLPPPPPPAAANAGRRRRVQA